MTKEQQKALALARARLKLEAKQPARQGPDATPRADEGRGTWQANSPDWTENIWGRGEIDTPGERVGATINDMGKSLGSGLGGFAANMLTLPQTLGGLADAGVEKLTGVPMQSNSILPDPAAITRDAFEATTGHDPETTAGRYAKTVGEFGPGVLLSPATAVAAGIGSEAAADVSKAAFPESPTAEFIARFIGGMGGPSAGRAAVNAVTGRPLSAAAGAVRSATPAIELNAKAKGLYADAERLGVTASAKQVQSVMDDAMASMKRAGIVAPNGKILKGYEKAKTAFDTLHGFKNSPMTPLQMQNVRRILMDAARRGGNEGRIGSQLVKSFDNIMEPLAPQIKKANKEMAKWFKAKSLDDIAESALDTVGANYTEAGYLTALRQKYRALLKRIRDGKEQGFTAEEITQMEKVVRGGRVENSLRRAGKVAPSNPLSAISSYSIPAAGAALSGVNPGLIAGLGAATYGLGRGASGVAARLQGKNAGLLDSLVRGGTKSTPQGPSVLEMLMGAGNAGGGQ